MSNASAAKFLGEKHCSSVQSVHQQSMSFQDCCVSMCDARCNGATRIRRGKSVQLRAVHPGLLAS
eukprot:1148607-Pelagomonas_calceolata.AAC.14